MTEVEMLFDCIDRVRAHFSEEPEKAEFWFQTKNLNLGGVSPMDLIRAGRVWALHETILNMLEGNLP